MTEQDQDKVLHGLNSCGFCDGIPNVCGVTDCPYKKESPWCTHYLAHDAGVLIGELLKAQVPKVLKAEEIADLKYHDMVFVEFKHPRKEEYRALGGFVDQMYKDVDTAEIKAIDITLGVNEIAHCSMKLYLNDFRLWTSCPKAEQMNAVPWV